ncbi:hypothetical protein Pan216_49780 [Planctomycetes bacterium Pan216]|uniref:Uncharacterized protein n=1 Tax=Kolteria novifilia TaxID=2527975 RepID=A0A518BAS9_9BACT|nr:hypothetical protein Pan216_49780 [Planctomycetes bacterium Pan216]
MRHTDELMDLRAERIELLQLLNSSSNTKRQVINKRLMSVTKKIQHLAGTDGVAAKD